MALEELKTACRQYCYDRDNNATLNIGSLTLTKIKHAFSFMRFFVQELLQNKPSSPSESGRGLSSEDLNQLEKFRQQVKNLNSLLLQRDSEINILVNMVKKNANNPPPSNIEDEISSNQSGNIPINSQNSSQKLKSSTINRQAQAKSDDGKMSKELQAKIIERHLFGVPPPTDKQIFDDAAASFEWFRSRSSLNQSVNENKEILKDKINEAKQLGSTAEQSRKTIEYLKKSIEQIRRDRYVSTPFVDIDYNFTYYLSPAVLFKVSIISRMRLLILKNLLKRNLIDEPLNKKRKFIQIVSIG